MFSSGAMVSSAGSFSTSSSTSMMPSSSPTSPTASGESSASSTPTGLDDEGGFLGSQDLGPISEDCTPAVQDCPAGEKCVWFSHNGGARRDNAMCIPVVGDLGPFEPCSLPSGFGVDITDDCDERSYCLEVYQTADEGFCAPFALDGSCADLPGSAPVFENGSDFPAACLMHPCHPLDPDACDDGMRCMFYPASLYAQSMCWVEPETPAPGLGAACNYGGCGPGQLCMGAEALPSCEHDRCCTQWCEFPSGECENPEASCEFLPVWNVEPDAFANLGACLSPGALESFGTRTGLRGESGPTRDWPSSEANRSRFVRKP